MKGGRAVARTAALAVLGSVVAGIAIGVGIHLLAAGNGDRSRQATAALHGQARWRAGTRPAPDFSLRDQDGRRISLASLRGRTVALTFLDSRCRQACAQLPRTLGIALRLLPRPERPALVVISVDPRHDTPSSVRAAAARWGLRTAPSWHWLLGSSSELAPV